MLPSLRPVATISFTALALLVGCGDDTSSSGSGGGGGGGGGTTSSSGDTSSTASGDTTSTASGQGGDGQGGGGTGGDGTGGGAVEVPCGDATCTAGDACIETQLEPECTNLEEGQMCPEGTTETQCGGAGVPCCCGEAPPPDLGCEVAPDCDGATPTCACADPCGDGAECTESETPGRLVCSPLPAP